MRPSARRSTFVSACPVLIVGIAGLSTAGGGIGPGQTGPGSGSHPAPGHVESVMSPGASAAGLTSIPFASGTSIDVVVAGLAGQPRVELVWVFDHTGTIIWVIDATDPDLAKFQAATIDSRTIAIAASTDSDSMKPVNALVPAFLAFVGIDDDGTAKPLADSVLEVAPWAGEQTLIPAPDPTDWDTCPVPIPSGPSVCSVVTQHLAPDKICILINLCNDDGSPAGSVKIAKCQQPDGTWICCGAAPPGECEPPGWSGAWVLQGSQTVGGAERGGSTTTSIDEELCLLISSQLRLLDAYLEEIDQLPVGFVFEAMRAP